MRRLGFGVALGLVALAQLAGCTKRRLRDEDVDLGAARAAFACDAKPTGDRADACRILDDFASAGAFQAWPTKGLETWFGRKVCSDAIDKPDFIDFGRVHLKPGEGLRSLPSDVQFDAARVVPTGAQFIASSAGQFPPALRPGYVGAIESAKAGTTPTFEGFSDFDRKNFVDFWETSKKPPGTPDFYWLVRTKGPSVVGAPYTTDTDPKSPSAAYFVRGKDRRMLVVYPWADLKKPGPTCVAELWRIYVAP